MLGEVEKFCRSNDLQIPLGLVDAQKNGLLESVTDLTFVHGDESRSDTVASALAAMTAGFFEPPRNLLPIATVDEASLACVVCGDKGNGVGQDLVVRWFLSDIDAQYQGALLDTDVYEYLESLDHELAAREEGLERVLDRVGPAYLDTYLGHEKRPRDFVVRPIRIACQNVIVALGAIAQDSAFDGLSVVAWQTCEVPHVATHEANRALAALTLADAFQNGGTMEIRFDRAAKIIVDGVVNEFHGHPEGVVPASLRRFGRTVGVRLGGEDEAAISPSEARALFLAITPMPTGLRSRVLDAVEQQGITPERMCFTLLSQTWREIELDFMLACSNRTGSILDGGADWQARTARQAEMEVARAAVMVGMLFRRLNGRDSAGALEGPRVIEDASAGVEWHVLDELGAVQFTGLDSHIELPWTRASEQSASSDLTVFFRSEVTDSLVAQTYEMQTSGIRTAVAVPLDTEVPADLLSAPLLRCPDRLADLDKQSEARLLTSRISRG
jgi:hypothetical protein